MAFERIPHFVGTPTRRDFLQAAGAGFGSPAPAGIFAGEATANQGIPPKKGGKAKRVFGRKFPSQMKLDALAKEGGLRQKWGRGRFLKFQKRIGGFDLDPCTAG